jgi:hypothetical protein
MVTIIARGYIEVAATPIPDVGENIAVVKMADAKISVTATANQIQIKTFTPAMVDDLQISTALYGTVKEMAAVMIAMDLLLHTRTMESMVRKN